MQIHPGLRRLLPRQLRRRIAGSGTQGRIGRCRRRTPHQPEIEQHRQTVPVPAQQVVGREIPMQELLAVQGGQHRQQLAEQQQHFTGAEHQLALSPGLQQLAQGASGLPLPHQPELVVLFDHGPEAGHLGMENPLQPAPEFPGPCLVLVRPHLPQGHRGIGSQQIPRQPEPALAAGGRQRPFQPVSTTDHRSGLASSEIRGGIRIHEGRAAGSRRGCCNPREASQSRS